MAGFKIVPFRGMLPRTAERLLGPGASVEAANLNITSGEIRPLKQPLLVNTPSVSGPWLSVYRAEHLGAQTWLAWNRDVDIVRAPLPATIEPRFYTSGDGEPRYARFQDLPATFRALGVPRPKAAPGVSHSGGTGAATTRVYVYTFRTALNEESGDSPASALTTGKVDGTWAISGMDAFPANSGAVTGVHAAGITTFTDTLNHWLRVGDEVVVSGATLTVTEVVSNLIYKVAGNYAAATAWARKAPWNTVGMQRLLYRSAGTTGSFQLVAEGVGTTYNDTLLDSAIPGDELISQGWDAPPPGLRGLIVLPNGAMVGFVDNQVCYSEPLQFHAWPESYRRSCDFPIVGVEAYGTTVVACTASIPYVLTGVEPASVTPEAIQKVWPCLSKRGVISLGDGVLYPTSYGLAYIGAGGAQIWTEAFFTRTEWKPLNPSTMVAATAEGRVYVGYEGTDGDKGVMIFDQAEGGLGLTTLSASPVEVYADQRNGQFYLVTEDGIYQFDAGIGVRLNYSWKSMEYHMERPLNLGAAKVDFVGEMTAEDVAAEQAAYDAAVLANVTVVANYKGLGSINGRAINAGVLNGSNIVSVAPLDVARVTFTLYADEVAVFSTTLIADQRAFRLPAGYDYENVAVGLTGAVRVKSVKLSTTMSGLAEL